MKTRKTSLLILLIIPIFSLAQYVAIEIDTVVSDRKAGNEENEYSLQLYPAISVAENGSFMITWEEYSDDNNDIYAQRFNTSDDTPGLTMQINDDVGNSQQEAPAIAMTGNGPSLIAWIDVRNGNPDIYTQYIDSSGHFMGDNVQIYSDKENDVLGYPSVAISGNGNHVISWCNFYNEQTDIHFQRFNASGDTLGPCFGVSDDTPNSNKDHPSIAMADNGMFAIAWEDYRNNESFPDIYVQRFDASGNKLDSNMIINDSGGRGHYYPSIAIANDGSFMVVWTDYRDFDEDLHADIYAQRFDSSGNKSGPNFRINDDESAAQFQPAIDLNDDGTCVVVWQNFHDGGPNIYAQLFDIDGNRLGNNFRINLNGPAENPSVRILGNKIFTTWDDLHDVYYNVLEYSPASSIAADMINNACLFANYPNPFNPITTIGFDNREFQHIKLQIFDITGRLVTTLIDGFKEAGHWDIPWNAGDQSSGIYIYRLICGDRQYSRKMLLMK